MENPNVENDEYKAEFLRDIEAVKDLTVVQWKTLTQGWTGVNMLFAKIAYKRSYEERLEGANKLFELSRNEADEDAKQTFRFQAMLWSLNDEVLGRLIDSFQSTRAGRTKRKKLN